MKSGVNMARVCRTFVSAMAVLACGVLELGAGQGCPKEYYGEISGVYWYDVWKSSTSCAGGTIDGVPHNELKPVCTGGNCPPADLVPYFVLPAAGGAATNAGKKPQMKKGDSSHPFNLDEDKWETVTIKYSGVAELKGKSQTYYFKLITLSLDDGKVRRIGVEVDKPKKAKTKSAKFTASPPTEPAEDDHLRYIDVASETFYVCATTKIE